MKLFRLATRLSLSSISLNNLHFQRSHPIRISVISMFTAVSDDFPTTEVPLKKHYNDFLRLDGDASPISQDSSNCALIMLNSATMDISLVKRLWKYCDYRICADGGANRLFDCMPSEEVAQYVPGTAHASLIKT